MMIAYILPQHSRLNGKPVSENFCLYVRNTIFAGVPMGV